MSRRVSPLPLVRSFTTALLFIILAASPWRAHAAVPAERPVSDPVYGPLSTYTSDPAVASDGENFLVVWHDTRLTPGGTYAARVSRAGVLLDPTGIRVPGYTYQAVPLFAGGVYVILTQEQGGLYAFTIGRDGTPAGRRLLTSNVPGDRFVAASNGTRIVVAWPGRLLVFNAAGDLLSARTVSGASTTLPPAIVSNGSGFLLAWRDSNYPPALNATVFDAMGQTGASSRVAVQVGSNVSLTSNGKGYLVIYDDVQTRSVLTRTISDDGLRIGAPSTIPAMSIGGPVLPVVWNGSNYLLFSRRPQNAGAGWPQVLTRSRLDASGSPLEPDIVVASGFEIGSIAAGSNGRDVLAAWSGRHVYEDLPNISVAAMGNAADPTTSGTFISLSANTQSPPSIAFSGSNYLVVRQERSGIYFNRVLPNGEHLDGSGVLIEPLPLFVRSAPRVVFDGNDFVVAWSTYAQGSPWVIKVARVRPDSGVVIGGPVTVAGSTDAGAFDLNAAGGGIVLVWGSYPSSGPHLNAARLDRNFQVIDIRDDLAPKGMSVANPAVAWNGSEWLVAFDQQFFCEVCLGPEPILVHANLLGVRLSSSFTLLDPQPIALAVSDSEYNLGASIATNGDEFLVAWTGGTPLAWNVRVRHLKTGALVDAIQTIASGTATSAAWDRDHYAIAYTATASTGTTYAGLTTAGTAGAPPRGERLLICATADSADHAQLAATPTGVTAAYIRTATEPFYGGVARIFIRDAAGVRSRAVRSP